MHKESVVVAIKVNGKILRENGDTVSLPFGSEYSILLKNLNSVRTQVKVSVDGTDATGGTSLIIGPNSSIDLERFIRNGNLQSGNRFKFIERTPGIEDHRGIGADDGLIRVESWKELITQRIPMPRVEYYDDPYPVPVPRPYPVFPPRFLWRVAPPRPDLMGRLSGRSSMSGSRPMHPTSRGSSSPLRAQAMSAKKGTGQREPERKSDINSIFEQSMNDAGITVPGSESQQQFHSVLGFPLEQLSTVIVMRLRGVLAGEPVAVPVTVDLKRQCTTCGKTEKSSSQFCPQCGTALVLV